MNLWLALLVGWAVTQVATLLTTIYLHRSLAHRALDLRQPTQLVCRALLWITTGMKPREWVAVHRKHHAASDTADDPHSPLVRGFWRVQLGNVVLYRRVVRDEAVVRRYTRDLPPDRLDRVVFDHGFVGLAIGVTLLVVLFGWRTAAVAAVVHVVGYLMLSAAINAVGHRFGRRPYENLATNNRWLALVTSGEGLHNNHHAAPTAAKLAHRRNEIDPAWFVIRALVAVGQARPRHDRPKVRVPELV